MRQQNNQKVFVLLQIMEKVMRPKLNLKLNFQPSDNLQIRSTSGQQCLIFSQPISTSATKLIFNRIFTHTHSAPQIVSDLFDTHKSTKQTQFMLLVSHSWMMMNQLLFGIGKEKEGLIHQLWMMSKNDIKGDMYSRKLKVREINSNQTVLMQMVNGKNLSENETNSQNLDQEVDIRNIQDLDKLRNRYNSKGDNLLNGSTLLTIETQNQAKINILCLTIPASQHPFSSTTCINNTIQQLCNDNIIKSAQNWLCCPICNKIRYLISEVKEWNVLFVLDQEEYLLNHPILHLIKECSWGVSKEIIKKQIKKQTEKQEATLKKLKQKYKSVLSILSKCVNLQWGQIERKSRLQIDFLQVNDRKTDKFMIANNKRIQNQAIIQELESEIAKKECSLGELKNEHWKKTDQLNCKKEEVTQHLAQIHKNIKELSNPPIKNQTDTPNNLIFFQNLPKTKKKVYKQTDSIKQNQESLGSKSNFPSYKNMAKSILSIREATKKDNDKSSTMNIQKVDQGEIIKQKQITVEIEKLFGMICRQEKTIEQVCKSKGHLLSSQTTSLIKSRKEGLKLDFSQIKDILGRDVDQKCYSNWRQDESRYNDWLKDLNQRSQITQTMTTIKEL